MGRSDTARWGIYSCVVALAAIVLSAVPVLIAHSMLAPGERPECDACVGGGMIFFVLIGIAIGLGGFLFSLVLAIVGIVKQRSVNGGLVMGIVLGLIAAATPFLTLFLYPNIR